MYIYTIYKFGFMNLVVRLQRVYCRNNKVYQIVVLHKFRKVSSGRYLEKLGVYSPKLINSKNKNFIRRIFFINLDRLSFWLAKGAIITRKVGFLIVRLIGIRQIII